MAVVKAGRYLLSLGLLAVFLLFFLNIFSQVMDKNNYGIRRSWQKMRTVDKHFFFDLLPSFDLPLSDREMYLQSRNIAHSQFSDIIDRVLLSRYLVDRFAYTSFIQFGCNQEQSIYQLLPDTSMKSRVCVDKKDGTVKSTPSAYLNSSYAHNRQFDLVVAGADKLSTDLLNSYLNMLSDGGSMLLTGSNNYMSGPNKTKEIHEKDLINLRCIVAVRGRQDLDLATLDADRGMKAHSRSNPLIMCPKKKYKNRSCWWTVSVAPQLTLSITHPVHYSPYPSITHPIHFSPNPSITHPIHPFLTLSIHCSPYPLLVGLSVIYKRRNSAHMDAFTTDTALSSLDQSTVNGDGIMLVDQELIEQLLNLMRFETLHDWLAPTGTRKVFTDSIIFSQTEVKMRYSTYFVSTR
jgi:hypothetical protein